VGTAAADVCGGASLCPSSVTAFGCVGFGVDSVIGVGCAGPLACAGVLAVPAPAVRASSARLMVYERNGASSEDVARAGSACGVGREGPLNNSGTNNTITTTRMIAPVSRSFTRLSKIRAIPLQSSTSTVIVLSITQATASPDRRYETSRRPERGRQAWRWHGPPRTPPPQRPRG
jgi:hypothetical protein